MPSPAALARLAIQAGTSFALYAGALVLATAFQSTHDAAVAADRYPLVVAAQQLRSQRQHTARELDAAVQALTTASHRYSRLDDASAAMADALDALARGVKRATGSAARLPAALPMPAAPTTVYVTVPAPAPATHTTTGASGR
ncbi:MAG TPA: hypothetical protein VFH98_01645 [Candidatus Limnocylindria bacterium]|nr:hypothetical protein [Candidatus Limnocylindria bacterium]